MPIEIVDPETGDAVREPDAIGVAPTLRAPRRWTLQSPRERGRVLGVAFAVAAILLGDGAYWNANHPLARLDLNLAATDHAPGAVAGNEVTYSAGFINTDSGAIRLTDAVADHQDVRSITLTYGGAVTTASSSRIHLHKVIVVAPSQPLTVSVTLPITPALCKDTASLGVTLQFKGRDRRRHVASLELDRTTLGGGDVTVRYYDPLTDPLLHPGVCPLAPGDLLGLPVGRPTRLAVMADSRLYSGMRLVRRLPGVFGFASTASGYVGNSTNATGEPRVEGFDHLGRSAWVRRAASLGPVSPDGRSVVVFDSQGGGIDRLDATTGRILGELSLAQADPGYAPTASWRGGRILVTLPAHPATGNEPRLLVDVNGQPTRYFWWDGASGSAFPVRADAATILGVSNDLDLNPRRGRRCSAAMEIQLAGTSCPFAVEAVSPDGSHAVVATFSFDDSIPSLVYTAGAADVGARAVALMSFQQRDAVRFEDATHWVMAVREQVATPDHERSWSILVRCSVQGHCERVPLPIAHPTEIMIEGAGSFSIGS